MSFLPFDFPQVEWGLKGLREVVNIHPLFVHFPIALLLTSFAAYSLGTLLRKEELLITGKWLLFFGTLAAATTVWSGLEAEKTVPHEAAVHETMIVHKYMGFTILGLALILTTWVLLSRAHAPRQRIPFLLGLFLLVLIITQSADLGGRMVFLHGTAVEVQSKAPGTSSPPHHSEEGHHH